MFFHKELFCEKCHTPIDKKNMCTFDYSTLGRNKDGKPINLCQECCTKELMDNLQIHTQKAVIVQPTDKYNAYVFYSFQLFIEEAKYSMNREKAMKPTRDIMSFLPSDEERCSYCSNPATYTWCTLNLFRHCDPYGGSFHINLEEKKNCVYLCKDCLINLLSKKIKEDNIHFRAIYPMVNDEIGYFTPWLY